ncbi:HD domain-containing protein [bacterium]|nr:HD domain-containing protein [bacterium]
MRIKLLSNQKQSSFNGNITQFFRNEIAKLKLAKEFRKDLLDSTDDEKLQCNIAYCDPYHILRIKELYDLGVGLPEAYSYSYNDGRFFNYIKELASEGKYDRYALLRNLGVAGMYIEKYVNLDEKEFLDTLTLLKSGVNAAIALDLARKYKNNLDEISAFSKTGQIGTNTFSYFLEKGKRDSRFSTENVVELANLAIFDERMISDILLLNKKDSVLNSDVLQTSKDAFQKIRKKRAAFFADDELPLNYLDTKTPYNTYDFLVNNLFDIGGFNLDNYPFEKKTKIYFELQTMINSGFFSYDEIVSLKLTEALLRVQKSITNPITPARVSSEDSKLLFKNFIANNSPQINQTLENFDFLRYEKTGLPLKYTRESYIKDLNIAIKGCSEEKRFKIYKKLEITPIFNKNSFGYNGVITLDNLDLSDSVEKEVYNISDKFINKNEIQTDDEEFNKIANSIIKGMPEFINIIGKKQHRNQTLDIHSFLVLQNVLKNPDFKKLSNKNKTIMKFVALLHDVAKQELTLDKAHPVRSSMYAKVILKKYKLHPDIQKNITDIILNHHWLENYTTGKLSADRVAFNFREDKNFLMAKILTVADLKGVSQEFFQMHKKQLSPSLLAPIEQKIEDINAHGQLIFASKIIRPDLIPKTTHKGREYKVVNFPNYKPNENLSDIGFEPHTNIDNLRLIVHMVKNPINLEGAFSLSELDLDSLLCASYISLKRKPTYYDLRFGLSLDVPFDGVANADKVNQSSGKQKGDAQFDYIITSNSFRRMIPEEFTKAAGIFPKEYGAIYSQISKNRYLSQIRDNTHYGENYSKISGKDLKSLIKKTDDKLLHRQHNELNVYKPLINAFVAKVDDIDEIPDVYLDFVYTHDLPIFILGR